ncbi:pfkB family carbohydrate kinase [Citrobacter koseri]|uniref:PfkB family carbohydrate kinase n=1 Tax=Citrobacter koseri TaxID=545 RepID=A0A2X2VQ59_CITKO|nr:pfkB family carbohydrate kinase [Citrobacter koseri]
MLVDHVHQIVQWPERGWLAEITHSERSTGGAPLNVLLTLAKMHTGLPLQAVGLIGQDADGDYIMAMLEQYHVNRQHVQRTTFAPHVDVAGDDRSQRAAHLFPLPRR